MSNLKETLTSVFTKLGVDSSSAEAQAILGNSALSTITVGDEISSKLGQNFYTLDSALQNPEILSKARAEALNGTDAHLLTIAETYGLDEATIAELKAEKKTTAKISKLTEKIAAAKEKIAKATGEDKDKLVEKFNTLQQEKINEAKALNDKIVAEQTGRKNDRVNWELDNLYNQLDYANPIDKGLNVLSAKTIIEKFARDKGVKFELGENGISLKTTSDTDYVVDNVKMTPQDFIKKTLIENKFIKVSTGNTQSQQTQTTTHQTQTTKGKTAYQIALEKELNANPLPQV